MICEKEKLLPMLEAEPIKTGYGLALDLGTKKVGAYLYDRASGLFVAETSADNKLSVFGDTADERVAYASGDEKMLRETAVLREQVFDLILELTAMASEKTGNPASFADVFYVSIAGNTVMQHLYAAISPRFMAEPPYRPVTLFGEEILAEPTMYYCPCLSGKVGGDLTAALLGSGASEKERDVLLIDLGEETGLALGNRDGFLCASVSAECAAAAVNELLQRKGLTEDKVTLLVSGAAGMTAEEAEKALKGLVSGPRYDRAVYVGNAAGYGACRALGKKGREELKKLAAGCSLL